MTFPTANAIQPSITRKIMRYSLWTLLGVLALLLGLITPVVLLNLQDEELTGRARQLVSVPMHRVAPTKNGFFILRAMDADPALDAWKIGLETVEAERRLFQQDPERSDYESKAVYRKAPTSVWNRKRCGTALTICIEADLQNRRQLEELIAQNAIYLQRYQALREFPEFEEHVLPTFIAPSPNYGKLVQAVDMAIVKASFDIADGRTESGVEQLQANDRFVRHMLVNSSTLISRMVTLSMLRLQTRAVSELVELYPHLLQSYGPQLAAIVRPLTTEEQSYGSVFQNEAVITAGFLNNMRIDKKRTSNEDESMFWLLENYVAARFFFKRNATVNLFADAWQAAIENGNWPASDYAQVRERIQDNVNKLDSFHGIPYVHYLYNPIGKILFGVGNNLERYVDYMERGADVDGYLRLVGLQIDLRRKHVSEAEFTQAIAAAKAFASSYDNKPMVWDAKARQLRFVGRQNATGNVGDGNVFIVQLR